MRPKPSVRPATDADVLPRPRHVAKLPGTLNLGGGVIRCQVDATATMVEPVKTGLRTWTAGLRRLHPGAADGPIPPINLRLRVDSAIRPQGYRIRLQRDQIDVASSSVAGFRHALATLSQLTAAGRDCLQCMQIDDWPDFAHRGLMLDISRDKVPTMRTIEAIVDRMAAWKLNQLQLYTEHTFAYVGHESVWRGASPMTAAQIRRLDAYCAKRGIELVPNQNSFGHMERWLKRPTYRDLAETLDGWKSPWGDVRMQATTLNPRDPRSIKLVGDLYRQLLPCFSSRQFNAGCDETFELGQGRSKSACERRGVGRVYFDFLMRIHKLVRGHGRRMQFWADIVQQHPELVASLPDDVIPLVWGYEADSPFDDTCRQLARRGLEYYVCPGTSSWCSFAGRADNCVANLRRAAESGLAHGAAGYLVTDWGDYGHRQYLPVSSLGFTYGAALSWCVTSNQNIDAAYETGRHAFDDPTGEMGRLWYDAGCVHEPLRVPLPNKTALFRVMHAHFVDSTAVAGLTAKRLDLANDRIRHLRKRAALALKRRRTSNSLVREELFATLAVLEHAVLRARVMLRGATTRAQRTTLRRQMKDIIFAHQRLWLARNRPGGLKDSLAHYERNLAEYSD